MAAADGVAVLLEVAGEAGRVQPLDDVHAGVVQSLRRTHTVIIIARVTRVQDTDLDGLMDLPRRGVVVSVVEPVPPVAEVR